MFELILNFSCQAYVFQLSRHRQHLLRCVQLNMSYQKLTYSGTECNNYVYFSFEAEYFNTDIITQELKIEPTSVKIKKDPVPKFTSWDFRVHAGNEVDLETYLATLIDVFEPKIEEIVRIKTSTQAHYLLTICY